MAEENNTSLVYLKLSKISFDTNGKSQTIEDKIHINVNNTTFGAVKNITDCQVKATSITYDMSMYNPDHFTAKLLLTSTTDIPMAAVAKELMGLKATMYYQPLGEKEVELSGNLVVYKATPTSSSKGSTKSIYVTLEIYSSDKLLELKKFSQSFTGLPLGKVISNNLEPFVPTVDETKPYKATYSLAVKSNKQILGYDVDHEIIQPYLVQYNETFRSMLNRTANRCGEFLYWHKQNLQYGLHNSTSTINLDSYLDQLSMSVETDNVFNQMSVSETHRSGNSKADEDKAGANNYDLETGMPDYNETVSFSCGDRGYMGYKDYRIYGANYGLKYFTNPNDNEYGDIDWDKSDRMTYVIGKLLTNYAKSGYIIDFITETLTDIAVGGYITNMKKAQDADAAKQKVNNKRFSSKNDGDKYGFKKEEQTNFSSLFGSDGKLGDLDCKSCEDYDKMEANYKIAPFSTLKAAMLKPSTDLIDDQVLGNDFYSKIRNYGKESAEQAIDITLLSGCPALNVGDQIIVNSNDYVITSIKCECKYEQTPNSSDGSYDMQTSVHAIPSVYSYEGNDFYIPEQLPEQNRIMDGNSTAIVTDNTDPYGQGRVRVRFTWQGKPEVQLGADELAKCHKDALEYAYEKGNDSDNEAAFTEDENSLIRKNKAAIGKAIVAYKIDKRIEELEAEGKTLSEKEKITIAPADGDSFYIITHKGEFKQASVTVPSDYETNKAKDPEWDKKEYKWKDVLDCESRYKKATKKEEKLKSAALKDTVLDKKKEDSTPWIRMASQMASEKAKVYMQTQVNDEVIIGFENGNPERPYVLGALYNGTAKAPSSGYSITGVNGETISMEDENMSAADLVGKLISPDIKTIMKLADPDAKSVDKKVVPVGGKISLKDKYGFYSMSMSSADRKIDIKCPLGDISISAFTGITLSAPNGDINIKGKNVNITAGDKITLTSGTNKDIYAWSPTELPGIAAKMAYNIATSAMKTFSLDFKVLDLSLIRSVWEVVYRPLNGTMLLHSKHHMMIQAGNGSAELPVDAIKATNAQHAVDVFPNYPYFLLKQIVKSYDEKFIAKLKTVQELITLLQTEVQNSRKTVAAIDNGRPTADTFKTEVTDKEDNAKPNMDKLSESIIEFVLKWDHAKKDLSVLSKSLKEKCPFPATMKDKSVEWYNKVWSLSVNAAALSFTTSELVKFSKDFEKSPAVEAALKALNNNYVSKKAWGHFNMVDLGDLTKGTMLKRKVGNADPTDFKLEEYIGSGAKIATYKSKTTLLIDAAKRRFTYNLVKTLYKQAVVYYLADGEEYKVGMKNYKTANLPEWDNDLQCVKGYETKTMQDFLKRVVPASWVNATDADSLFSTAAKDVANTLLNELYDIKNINWMAHQERNLWDTATHPGLIMMSDEKGTTTTTLNVDGKFEATDNTSVNSVLTALGREKSQDASAEDKAKNLNCIYVRKRGGMSDVAKDPLGITTVRTIK